MLLLTLVLLPSATPLAVPPAAQSQLHHRKQQIAPTISGGEQVAVSDIPMISSHQQQIQSQNGSRKPFSSIDLIRFYADTSPDLYNITLKAMKQYIRSQLNSTRLGKGPRKRSHHHSDAEFDFYMKFKEFNNTQSAVDSSNSVGISSSRFPNYSNQSSLNASTGPSVGQGNLRVDDTMAAFKFPLDTDVVKCGDAKDDTGVERVSNVDLQAAPSGTINQKDYNVLMDDPRGYLAASSLYPERPAKTTSWDSAFIRQRACCVTGTPVTTIANVGTRRDVNRSKDTENLTCISSSHLRCAVAATKLMLLSLAPSCPWARRPLCIRKALWLPCVR
ncbi:uncharacterized protein LOC131688095 [Topomyia yanbarensis]|uniref:uncharacterized protein LOC131688095 n=1 Tax=Topomyia yanbarensis TaxID=2498891 RepID=UPI00273C2F3E|nr:uncharacterized protein LOC131688095 [Topomyia yanbarensis]